MKLWCLTTAGHLIPKQEMSKCTYGIHGVLAEGFLSAVQAYPDCIRRVERILLQLNIVYRKALGKKIRNDF